MSDQDPTRRQEPVPEGTGPREPTSVVRTTETSEPPRPPVDPRGGGVAIGVAIAAALVVGLLGLLAGIVLFGGDDDDDAADDVEAVEETVPDEDPATAALEDERDELAQQVEDLESQVNDLQTQLDEVTQQRDDLAAQLEDAQGDQTETVPAPDVVGGTVSDAESVAGDNGWTLVERTVDSGPGDAEPGTVVAQYPEPGADMVDGSVLVVDVPQESEGDS